MSARADPVAYPPRGMGHMEAARYIGLSPSKFMELVKEDKLPKPVRIDRRVMWDRQDLDAAFDTLRGDGLDESWQGVDL